VGDGNGHVVHSKLCTECISDDDAGNNRRLWPQLAADAAKDVAHDITTQATERTSLPFLHCFNDNFDLLACEQ